MKVELFIYGHLGKKSGEIYSCLKDAWPASCNIASLKIFRYDHVYL